MNTLELTELSSPAGRYVADITGIRRYGCQAEVTSTFGQDIFVLVFGVVSHPVSYTSCVVSSVQCDDRTGNRRTGLC